MFGVRTVTLSMYHSVMVATYQIDIFSMGQADSVFAKQAVMQMRESDWPAGQDGPVSKDSTLYQLHR